MVMRRAADGPYIVTSRGSVPIGTSVLQRPVRWSGELCCGQAEAEDEDEDETSAKNKNKSWPDLVELPVPRSTSTIECESTAGSPAAAARQSVGSTPASSENVAYLRHHKPRKGEEQVGVEAARVKALQCVPAKWAVDVAHQSATEQRPSNFVPRTFCRVPNIQFLKLVQGGVWIN